MYAYLVPTSTVQANHEPQVDVHISVPYESLSLTETKEYVEEKEVV